MNRYEELSKHAVKLAVHRCGGGTAAEELTGLDMTLLSRWANPDHSEVHIKLWQFLALDEAAGFVALKSIARRFGFDLISKEQREQLLADVAKLACRSMQAHADLVSTGIEAVSDSAVSENEFRATMQKASAANEANDAIVEAVGALRVVK